MNIAILILAAGNSSRMGVAKQLLPIGKTTLLGVTIENALQSNANQVSCILGANAEAVRTSISKYNIESIFNPNYESGLSSSIVSGIQYIINQNFDAVLILLGDQPLIKGKYLNEMINTYKNNGTKIIASTYDNTFGVPTIIPKTYFNQLLKLKGDKGAKDFLNTRKEDIIPLKKTNLMDIDTKKEYQDYLNSINFE
ncbi:nucleotidyltransferase family protein [Winogradskyella sp.]|uniref:nucleotidyltransferase family protein n=1 Tax=Winogradskyella sp. TaxID=1883156 RepID=UPI0025E544FB|nr:nucleotidyltransferase family protein [Winogradskyella sp.]